MTDRIVVVFGGTGFLGRRVAQHLLDQGFAVRVAARHLPERAPRLHSVRADIRDRHAIETAIAGAYALVNAVSLYVERGRQTFHSVHVEAGGARGVLCAAGRHRAPCPSVRHRRRSRLSLALHP
jgi:uncharacterized protein YbjT (DUF2867 family)